MSCPPNPNGNKMIQRHKEGSLTDEEKRIVKTLLQEGMRNQDIQYLVNIGRHFTINSARITSVKQDTEQEPASQDEVELFKEKKTIYEPVTGLNEIDDERLIRAREAMLLAVNVFNSTTLKFKTEIFAVLSNIAWTYLLHEYHENTLNEQITKKNGETVSLYEMLSRDSRPLSNQAKKNLLAIKQIRDEVEHKLFGRSDTNWLGIFQACCVNFDTYMCTLFGERLSLQPVLGFALQFAKISLEQISETQGLSIPARIQALDARLNSDIDESDPLAAEYKFQVVYTLDSTQKGGANIRFIHPSSSEGLEIHNILVKKRIADEEFPYKPFAVVEEVQKAIPQFSTHTHQLAWKRHKVRPKSNAKNPDETDRRYCIYHAAHSDYTYSKAWIDLIISTYRDEAELNSLRSGNW